jgi:hypothetical protein
MQEASRLTERLLTYAARTSQYENYIDKLNTGSKKFGLKEIGSGVFRVAYRYKDLVIKTHLDYNDKESIETEVESWQEIRIRSSPAVALFNPILKAGMVKWKKKELLYSISPYVLPFESNKLKAGKDFNKYWEFIETLIPDSHVGNIGIFNSLPIIIDYQDVMECDFDSISTTLIPRSLRQKLSRNKKQLLTLAKLLA